MVNYLRYLFFIIFILFFITSYSATNEGNNQEIQNNQEKDNHESEEFYPGKFIFDHIVDSHEWHIITYKNKHISIPLPVIIYSKYSGFHIFSSRKFHHGHSSYKGFELPSEGEFKGKIIERLENNKIYLPLDISITKDVLAIIISSIILVLIIFSIKKAYLKRPCEAPKGFQNLLEPVIIFIRDDVAKPSIGEKKYEKFMPFLLTLFLFILFNNLLGLIPIPPAGANVTGNIAVTMVLALFTFTITALNGNKNYWRHIFNAPGIPWWLKLPIPLIPLIELIGMFIKPFVLMVRLFANISAGHIIALGFFSLIFIFGQMNELSGYGISIITIAFSIFMTCLELLVAFIQAYVFTLLSAIYFGMAVEEHH
ncbi:MAG: F0F1 ATP synthase subunit A [Bacteroidales bacterium]|nr:F0F1 ATP synthase subunit A [Bacteroidales bacterium]